MRSLSKYKIFTSSKKIIDIFPVRLKRFKRTKWIKFRFFNKCKNYKKFKFRKKSNNEFKSKKLYLIKFKYKSVRYLKLKSELIKYFKPKSKSKFISYSKFKNLFVPVVGKGRKNLVRMKKYYKNSLIYKNGIIQQFDKSFSIVDYKKDLSITKNLSYVDLVKLTLIKQLYSLKILIWSLNFFSSSYECSQAIKSGYILVNNQKINFNCFLKKGDIISIDKNIFLLTLKKNIQNRILSPKIYSFLEIDFYTCTIVIIKNFAELDLKDFSLLLPKLSNVNKLYNNIKY